MWLISECSFCVAFLCKQAHDWEHMLVLLFSCCHCGAVCLIPYWYSLAVRTLFACLWGVLGFWVSHGGFIILLRTWSSVVIKFLCFLWGKNVAIVYEHSSIHNQLALFSICLLLVVISWQVIKFVIIFLYLNVFVNMWQNIWVCIKSSNPFKS